MIYRYWSSELDKNWIFWSEWYFLLFGEIVLGPSLAWAQCPPQIFPSSQPHLRPGPTLTWAHVSSIGYFLPYNTHTERCNKYKVLTWHRNAANIQSKRLPYLYQKGTRHDKNRTVRYMNETNPPFWRNSPGTLPGPGPITSLDISFLPTPSQQGTLPDLGPFSSLGYILPYIT